MIVHFLFPIAFALISYYLTKCVVTSIIIVISIMYFYDNLLNTTDSCTHHLPVAIPKLANKQNGAKKTSIKILCVCGKHKI